MVIGGALLMAGGQAVLAYSNQAPGVVVDFARTFNPPDRRGRASGVVNLGSSWPR